MQLMLDFEDQNPNMFQQHWQPVLAYPGGSGALQQIPRKDHAGSRDGVRHLRKDEPWRHHLLHRRRAEKMLAPCASKFRAKCGKQLNRIAFLYLRDGMARADFQDSPIDFYRGLVDKLHAFQGTSDATMISRRRVGFPATWQIPRTRRLHLAGPRHQIPHPSSTR